MFLLYLSTSILGVSLFSYKFYKNSGFRRTIIECLFNSYDYCYNTFYKLWYDDKIRITSIKTERIDLINKLMLLNTKIQDENENDMIINHFLNENIKYQKATYKDKCYYLLGPISSVFFGFKHIMESKWLAASIEITTKDDKMHSFDITESIKEFWIEGNMLPFHVEYYDYWILNLLRNSGMSLGEKLFKMEIKDLSLNIINEIGDIEIYNNVLIMPRNNDLKIIEFICKDKT
jgi:hypothetical protein